MTATASTAGSSARFAVPSQYRPKGAREIYTVAEVAQLLGLALGGTYELVRDGTIPALKLGGRWVIPKKRFHAWLDGLDLETAKGETASAQAGAGRMVG